MVFVQTKCIDTFILNPPAGPSGVSPADVCAEEPPVSANFRLPVPAHRLRYGKLPNFNFLTWIYAKITCCHVFVSSERIFKSQMCSLQMCIFISALLWSFPPTA